jgi:hypothetical protein
LTATDVDSHKLEILEPKSARRRATGVEPHPIHLRVLPIPSLARDLPRQPSMPERATIAHACALPAEQATVMEWLRQSGYTPLGIADLSRLDEDLQANPIEALVADVALVPYEDEVRTLVRRLGKNRPLVMVGDAKRLPSTLLGDLSVVPRPFTRESLAMSVALALAEGRPARRLPRRAVEPIRALANGTAATVVELSAAGVGLEMGSRPSVLPPHFGLRIPDFGVHVVVKRAWMAPIGRDAVRCGGTIEGELPGASRTWPEFVLEAPGPVSAVMRGLDVDEGRRVAEKKTGR